MSRLTTSTNAHASSSRTMHTSRRAKPQVPASSPISGGDDDDSEEERRKKSRVSGARVAVTNGNGAAHSEENEDEGGEDFEGWTEETYQPQPLKKDVALNGKLLKIQQDINAMQEALDQSMARAVETAAVIEDCSPGDDMVEEIAQGLCRSIEIRHVLGIRHAVLNAIRGKLNRGEEVDDAATKLEAQTAAQTAEYMKKTARQKFSQAEKYISFRNDIWQVNHPSEPCPPMSHWLARAEDDESDDEMEMGPQKATYRCDITHGPIQNAMYNPACKHHFSRDAIEGLFAQHTSRGPRAHIKCPAVGCNKEVYKNELRPDPEYQAKADQHHIRETQREAEDVEDLEDFTQE